MTNRAEDYSEQADGPLLTGIRGDDSPMNEFRLGTREYGWHQHLRGQLFCVETGMIQLNTGHDCWLLPPYRAGWIPPNTAHQVRVSGAIRGWTLFIAPELCSLLPTEPCVITINDVLRALAERVTEWDKTTRLTPAQDSLARVIIDEINQTPDAQLQVPLPQDPRLLKVTRAVLSSPGDPRTLEQWASFGAMSARTLSRLISTETGMSFAQWRQQVKLMYALNHLAEGISVAEISHRLGYASPSNFIAMFRKIFADSPAHYFSASPKHHR